MNNDKSITVITSKRVYIGVQFTPSDFLVIDFLKSAPIHIKADYFLNGVWLQRKSGVTFIPQADILQVRETTALDKES